MNELTDFDKKVYNLYLKYTRKHSGGHYRVRKNFSNISESYAIKIKKLSSVFERLPHLMREEYFIAPFEIRGGKYYDLDFYSSPKAIGDFSKFCKNSESKNPDEQVDYIKKSFMFIYEFCKDKKIELREYPFYSSVSLPDCLKHIKEHNVSAYVCFCFPELYSVLINLDSDIYNMFFGNMNLMDLQINYERSNIKKSCFLYKEEISKRLKKFLESQEL